MVLTLAINEANKKTTNADPEMLARFEKEAQKAHDDIRKKVKYYKEGGLDPQDKDMNKYIINLKHDLWISCAIIAHFLTNKGRSYDLPCLLIFAFGYL